MKKGLIVFARAPIPGKVKTRLAATFGDQAATELYETMLQDVLKTTRQLNDIEPIVFWDCDEELLPHLAERFGCRSRLQKSGDLGQRMQEAFEEMFASGFESCCIIGSDAPDLPLSYIMEAYRLLAAPQADVVFGPSKDGGYYLLGLRQIWGQLFAKIPWSSAAVLEQSLAAVRDLGLAAALLPEWQDIDTAEDLQAFQKRKRLASPTETT
ncbi:MAG: TIGR04282 family arsenosugar biosynthesis glycosyltransferase [Desulfuromonadaceae bacterium]|nr:TIGR04282 family arsenosugar biosynthesis glycosyltransferase [Desulfuromonadaceae bacterium]